MRGFIRIKDRLRPCRLFFTILIGLFFSTHKQANATHIVGGEFVFTHQGGDDYTIALNLFFDDVNGNPGAIDPEVDVSVFSKATNARKDSFLLPLVSDSYVPYTSIDCTVGSLSTRLLVYEITVTLDPLQYTNPGGYYMVWQRCCRNGTINNIIDPGATGQTFYLEFPPLIKAGQRFINSSPTLFAPLSDYACAQDPFHFDFSGTDPDGDSLDYSMITPLAGANDSIPNPSNRPAPYDSILWESGYGLNSQIQGTPPLSIDQKTGLLSVQANQAGLFVFGIRCREYRNGIKIGEVRRDFQLLTLTCPTNDQPQLTVFGADNSSVYQPADTLLIGSGSGTCLTIAATDSDPNERLRYRIIPVNFSAPLPTLGVLTGTINNNQPGNDSLITQLCFPRCFQDTSKVYLMDLLVFDDGCSQPKQDTIRITFKIDGTPNQPPRLLTDLPGALTLVSTSANLPVTFNLIPSDPELQEVQLSLLPADIQKANAARITFPAGTYPNNKPVPVSWNPDCTYNQADSLIRLHYVVKDKLECGTRRSDTLEVTFRYLTTDDALPFLPGNIFTPNEDGINDYFELPKGTVTPCNNTFASIRIFNRWGNPVFQSSDSSFKWEGKNTPDGLYYYLVDLNNRLYKGWVEIVR